MTEEMRHEIVQRRQAGASLRTIAEELGISRGAVYRALQRVQAQRDGRTALTPRARKRVSIVDSFEPILKELLAKYPYPSDEHTSAREGAGGEGRDWDWQCAGALTADGGRRLRLGVRSPVSAAVSSGPATSRAACRALASARMPSVRADHTSTQKHLRRAGDSSMPR